MSDSDKDCNGDDNCIECAPEVEVWPVGTGDMMRDLAEALREFYPHPERYSECDAGFMALAKYDRMTGGDDAE